MYMYHSKSMDKVHGINLSTCSDLPLMNIMIISQIDVPSIFQKSKHFDVCTRQRRCMLCSKFSSCQLPTHLSLVHTGVKIPMDAREFKDKVIQWNWSCSRPEQFLSLNIHLQLLAYNSKLFNKILFVRSRMFSIPVREKDSI